MANGTGGSPQEKTRYFCHSCGGVSTLLTAREAEEFKKEGHDLEIWPPKPQPAEVIRG